MYQVYPLSPLPSPLSPLPSPLSPLPSPLSPLPSPLSPLPSPLSPLPSPLSPLDCSSFTSPLQILTAVFLLMIHFGTSHGQTHLLERQTSRGVLQGKVRTYVFKPPFQKDLPLCPSWKTLLGVFGSSSILQYCLLFSRQ